MPIRRVSVPFFVVLLAVAAGPVRAANVLNNPNFDTSVSPAWTVFAGTSWDNGNDYGGNPGPNGSAVGIQPAGTSTNVAQQCVSPVTPSVAYSLGAKVRVATGSTGGWIDVIWYPAAGCTGSPISTSSGQTVSTTGSWLDSLPSGGNPITSPGTAASAMVEIVMNNTLVGASATANFDNTFFGPGTFPVELQSFTAE